MSECETTSKIDLSNSGERRIADEGNWSYYAHLSIYHFALSYVAEKRVLDAGCGTGYGTAYLSQSGAKTLLGCDNCSEAIAFCRTRYSEFPVHFEVVDLCKSLPYLEQCFDVIFSSNVLEHLFDIDKFLSECRRTVAPDGIMIIAVPPIVTPLAFELNLQNVFHVTNLTPWGWHSKINRYFENLRCFIHRATGIFADHQRNMEEISRPLEDVTIRETDFSFVETTINHLNSEENNITAVLVASRPRNQILQPTVDEQIPYEWFSGQIISRLIAKEREASAIEKQILLRQAAENATDIDQLRLQVENLKHEIRRMSSQLRIASSAIPS